MFRIIRIGPRIPANISTMVVINRIKNYYRSRGYILVKIYILKNRKSELSIFIDEGRLSKILYLNIDTLATLKVRLEYRFPGKIFNKYKLFEIIKSLRKKQGYNRAYYKLKKTKSYRDSIFQLDREVSLPILGNTQLPFFNKFGKRFYLEIHLAKNQSNAIKRNEGVINYTLKTSYTKGFMPKVSYYYYDLVMAKDRFGIGISTGIMYGIDGNFKDLPRMTFAQLDLNYNFTPFFQDYFTPLITYKVYISDTSRDDIGVSNYRYLLLRGSLKPGITLAKKLKFHTGIGAERIYFMKSEYNTGSSYRVDIEEGITYQPFWESEIKFNFSPLRFIPIFQNKIILIFDYYFYKNIFYELTMKGSYDYNYRNISKFILEAEYNKVWGDVPFYHEIPVSSSKFKGFMGKSYHSWHTFSFSNEFRFSIYKDFIYTGVYIDFVQFAGSGYDLSGSQSGVVFGPTMRFLIYDQFEAYVYYGKDYLFSNKESQFNLVFGLRKKW